MVWTYVSEPEMLLTE